MQNKTFQALTKAAEHLMERPTDPIHDTGHASRVVTYLKHMQGECGLTKSERQAIIIAGWWHDVSRIITKNPSLVWMPLVDDLLSGGMLLWHLLKSGIYEWDAYLAIRLIWGKSLGTGAFLKKILLSKRNQFLAHLLKDADTLDTFAIERAAKMLELVDGYLRYEIGYKIVCRWFSLLHHIKMKTAALANTSSSFFVSLSPG